MNRPYIVCHMVVSIDGKVTGDFLGSPACERAVALYYDLHRRYPADGFICGRVTMEGSFTGGWYPDLTAYEAKEKTDYLPKTDAPFYAIAFDTSGKLGWKQGHIVDPDGDPGYDGAQVVEVLSERVDARYLGYLQSVGIPYVFAGKEAIDVTVALSKLKELFGMNALLLEGGSVLNGSFERAGVIDKVCLVTAPMVADKESKPLFDKAISTVFQPEKAEICDGTLVCYYTK